MTVDLTTTGVIGLPELFSILTTLTAQRGELAQPLKQIDADIANVRASIEATLRDSGATSHTDAATGINARIETRKEWKVTDPDALFAWSEGSRFRIEVVDTKAAIESAKAHPNDPTPGIEQVESAPFLKITPPKGGK